MPPAHKQEPPTCPYCGNAAELVTGKEVYGPRKLTWLHDKRYWLCRPCEAWVGVHDGTIIPLGRLADKELRIAKQSAHAVFDPLWEAKMRRDGCSKTKARGAAYKWLAEQLGIDPADCHIGMMDVPTINRVVRICRAVRRRETTDA
jgi:uncharacterized protein DUF3268